MSLVRYVRSSDFVGSSPEPLSSQPQSPESDTQTDAAMVLDKRRGPGFVRLVVNGAAAPGPRISDRFAHRTSIHSTGRPHASTGSQRLLSSGRRPVDLGNPAHLGRDDHLSSRSGVGRKNKDHLDQSLVSDRSRLHAASTSDRRSRHATLRDGVRLHYRSDPINVLPAHSLAEPRMTEAQ